jgi:hypothetical protein
LSNAFSAARRRRVSGFMGGDLADRIEGSSGSRIHAGGRATDTMGPGHCRDFISPSGS